MDANLASISERYIKPVFQSQAAHRIRVVSQTNLVVKGSAGALQSSLMRLSLGWLERSAYAHLSELAWRGESFELDGLKGHRVAGVSLPDIGYWSARLDFADRDVPQRSWVTEIGIGKRSAEELVFGCRLQCVTLGEDAPFTRSVPRLVRDVIEETPAYLDSRRAQAKATHVANVEDVSSLVKLICDPSRRHDVVVVSLPDGTDDPLYALISTDRLARRCAGAGHIVTLTSEASFALTDILGKELSVFNGAVRSYRPNFFIDDADPAEHPLALKDRILAWNGVGPLAFAEFVAERLLGSTVRGRDLEGDLPSFQKAKSVALERERKARTDAGATEADLLALADEEIKQLKNEIKEKVSEADALLLQADTDLEQLENEVQRKNEEVVNLRARVQLLEKALHDSGAPRKSDVPKSFDVLIQWAAENLSGSVVLLPRAIRAAQKSPFEDVPFAYKALLLMRDYYVRMRRGEVSRQSYESALAEAGLEDLPCFAGDRSGQFGDEYFVRYGGRRRELDRHIKGSNSRDPRYGFRLYFFFDEDSGQVVVGSFPEHLTNDAT